MLFASIQGVTSAVGYPLTPYSVYTKDDKLIPNNQPRSSMLWTWSGKDQSHSGEVLRRLAPEVFDFDSKMLIAHPPASLVQPRAKMWSKHESNLVLNGVTLFDIGATV